MGVPPSQIPGSAGCPQPEGGGYPSPPQSEGGTGPNATKRSPNGPQMRFGAILDHLEATFIHFGPFEKNQSPFWVPKNAIFCPFWAACAASPEMAQNGPKWPKIDQNDVKNRFFFNIFKWSTMDKSGLQMV